MSAFFSNLPMALVIPGLYLSAGLLWILGLKPAIATWLHPLLPTPYPWADGLYLMLTTGFLMAWLHCRQRHEQQLQTAIALRQSEERYRLLNQELEVRVEQRTAELRASLEEKDLLLKEVHHRVKNNLQVIASLFSLQSQSTTDPIVQSLLADSQNRISTMALIHEKLYQTHAWNHIHFQDYVRNLTTDLVAAANLAPQQIQLDLTVDDVALDLDTAMRCGLIINELVSNALKHGFPNGQSGRISLQFAATTMGDLQLNIRDTGVGLPLDLEQRMVQSLGLRLVRILVRKLKGHLEIGDQGGASFQISFPRKETP